MTTRHEKAKAEADRLLALRERHRLSNTVCSCGAKPLTSRDPMARIFVVDADQGMCEGCAELLQRAGIDDWVMMYEPREAG